MASQDQLVLFGFDLRPYLAQLSLAYRQLIWGEESGLRALLSVPAKVWTEGSQEPRFIDPFGNDLALDNVDPSDFVEAVCIAERFVLQRRISLPETVESQLTQVVQMEVQNCSPFAPSDTRFGFRILRRSEGSLLIGIVVTSAEFINATVAQHPTPSLVSELWSSFDGAMVRITDHHDAVARDNQFIRRLARLALGSIAVMTMFFMLLMLPTAVADIRSEQYREQLSVAEENAAEATALREELVSYNEKLSLASELIAGREHYGIWLHTLADLSPDSVYLKQLEFAGNKLSIRGYGENGAAYQSRLVESERFSDVTATSPFRRNPQLELEEFTFELTLRSDKMREEMLVSPGSGGF